MNFFINPNMSMGIDKARCHDTPFHINHLCILWNHNFRTHRNNFVIFHQYCTTFDDAIFHRVQFPIGQRYHFRLSPVIFAFCFACSFACVSAFGSSLRIVNAIRPRRKSTSSTRTVIISPTDTTSIGCLINLVPN